MNRLTPAAGTYAAHSFSYSPGSNRQVGITYDGMGNDLTNASYDDSGRLSTASLPNSDTLRLYYNGYGELARTRLSHRDACNNEILLAREDFSFTPDGRALSVKTNNTVTVNVDYIWLDHLPVAQFQDSYDSTGTYIATETTYLHPDHLGTPRIGTDAARNITWRYRSDAFGIAELSGTANVRLRFPGQLNLGAEGFNYNYFRDYRPDTGRYLESDPIGLEGGINTYAYVAGNPLSRADPLGLWTWPSPAEVARYWYEVIGSGVDFLQNYRNLRVANQQILSTGLSPSGADKYFHCMANCEASRRGPAGEDTSCSISDTREWADQTFKGYPPSDSAADQLANRLDRKGGMVDREQSCRQICRPFRIEPMPAVF
ncbi:MAG: hypothetical protein DYH20_08685 [Gammaproteobacteria bacterium PRO9]|nr:hypothetical protein [Gammaproteobacteria bacterium PRO9]